MAEFRIVRDVDGDTIVMATCEAPDDPTIPGPVVCRTTDAPGTDQTFGTVHEVREHVTTFLNLIGDGVRVDPPEWFEDRDRAAAGPVETDDESDERPVNDRDTAGS